MDRSSEQSGGGAERSRSGGAFARGGQGILAKQRSGRLFREAHPSDVRSRNDYVASACPLSPTNLCNAIYGCLNKKRVDHSENLRDSPPVLERLRNQEHFA